METDTDIIDIISETIAVNCACGAVIIAPIIQEYNMIACPKCEKEHILTLTTK